ncbi:hypothetical protein H257_04842 [Aphanomyces astaci]|uniref:Uncharacterized protein n=1 Tax=Aphanomyces astaci TaxID=112090 RepID=W4GUZ4_APHAT|nr:hypothetical protein H257_04842 [Aphanomyces astaci]ETV83116.1 hypothetical protein H257_04842 [Aphanomyces astaci]RHX97935.1 hypothetical protein DYB25_008961 [Aphanomyces astaci]RHY07313.1 hypothetical protein DYB36_002885 [Aphanomyces astaci]RHY49734.1 hypothetical protein DYB30_003411 [Aphanomyces astaci]RHY57565.1 hypothetical protein DYB38_005247 [Aphanomyces astaci]|eukprot:XP_009827787.1 hypothetical protein H257_04842 [Aphanomyces astaci]
MAKIISTTHQVLLAVLGLLSTIAAVYALAEDTYLSSSPRLDVANVFLRLYQLFFALVLLSTAALGWKVPLKWFSFLESYVGSGLFVIFLGFYTYRLLNDYGLYSAWIHFVVGGVFVVYGLFAGEQKAEYTPILPQ